MLDLACDLADGFPPEKAMRTAVLAVGLGRRFGLGEGDLRDVYYAAVARYLGCTAFGPEEAHRYGAGDDIRTRNVMALADAADPVGTAAMIARGIGAGAGPLQRLGAMARLLGDGRAMAEHARSQCEASERLAALLGLGEGVRASMRQVCERWDGRGLPRRQAGEELGVAIRVVHVAEIVEVAHHRDGPAAAVALARRRAGGQLDPRLADVFVREAPALLATIAAPSVWDEYLAAEPLPHAVADERRIDDVALAFAYLADLKSTFTCGHSTGVAALAERAAEAMGLDAGARRLLRRAALLHDLGRVCVPNGIWDKPGRLSAGEMERVRLHAYYTERVVTRSPALRPLAEVAAAAHERGGGGGYHRGLPAALLAPAARLLAAADAFHAMREARPHRPALSADEAARALSDEASGGGLDRAATRAVLEAAGAAPARGGAWPAGLSDREVEVLGLLARGLSNKEIAARLDISARTVQHHVMHLYAKIEVSSRAAAALFAVEHGLLPAP